TFIFECEEKAAQFASNLSLNILRYFPGIELFLIKKEIEDWEKGELQGLLRSLRNELAKKKNERRHAVKQESWGIQKACASSGLPANIMLKNQDNEDQP